MLYPYTLLSPFFKCRNRIVSALLRWAKVTTEGVEWRGKVSRFVRREARRVRTGSHWGVAGMGWGVEGEKGYRRSNGGEWGSNVGGCVDS